MFTYYDRAGRATNTQSCNPSDPQTHRAVIVVIHKHTELDQVLFLCVRPFSISLYKECQNSIQALWQQVYYYFRNIYIYEERERTGVPGENQISQTASLKSGITYQTEVKK